MSRPRTDVVLGLVLLAAALALQLGLAAGSAWRLAGAAPLALAGGALVALGADVAAAVATGVAAAAILGVLALRQQGYAHADDVVVFALPLAAAAALALCKARRASGIAALVAALVLAVLVFALGAGPRPELLTVVTLGALVSLRWLPLPRAAPEDSSP